MIMLSTDEVAQKEKRALKILRIGKYSPEETRAEKREAAAW